VPSSGIVAGERLEHNRCLRVDLLLHSGGQFKDGVLAGVADVDGSGVSSVVVHQSHQTLHHVRHVAEAARLGTVTVYRDRLAGNRLDYEVADDTTIIL